jgi:hypothetical protein
MKGFSRTYQLKRLSIESRLCQCQALEEGREGSLDFWITISRLFKGLRVALTQETKK